MPLFIPERKKVIYFGAFFIEVIGYSIKPWSCCISLCRQYLKEIFKREIIRWKWF